MIDGNCKTFTNNRSHTTTNKTEVHTCDHKINSIDFTNTNSSCIRHFGLFLSLVESLSIFFAINKIQWVHWKDMLTELFKLIFIKNNIKILSTTNTEMITTIWINPAVFNKLATVDSFTCLW